MPAALTEKAYSVLNCQDYPPPCWESRSPCTASGTPTEWLKGQTAANETRIQALTGEIEDRNAYYIGRCGGDVLTGLIGFAESFRGSTFSKLLKMMKNKLMNFLMSKAKLNKSEY